MRPVDCFLYCKSMTTHCQSQPSPQISVKYLGGLLPLLTTTHPTCSPSPLNRIVKAYPFSFSQMSAIDHNDCLILHCGHSSFKQAAFTLEQQYCNTLPSRNFHCKASILFFSAYTPPPPLRPHSPPIHLFSHAIRNLGQLFLK